MHFPQWLLLLFPRPTARRMLPEDSCPVPHLFGVDLMRSVEENQQEAVNLPLSMSPGVL